MKIVKSSLLVSFFLLMWSLSIFGKPNIPLSKTISNFDFSQSPLSDDETNPVNQFFIEFNEFDLEDKDENNAQLTVVKIIPFLTGQNLSIPCLSYHYTIVKDDNQHTALSSLHSSQSYLQIFRI